MPEFTIYINRSEYNFINDSRIFSFKTKIWHKFTFSIVVKLYLLLIREENVFIFFDDSPGNIAVIQQREC